MTALPGAVNGTKALYFARNIVGLFLLAGVSSATAASNYAECIIDTLPGTQSQAAFTAGMQLCAAKYPDRMFVIKRGAGRGILGFKSANACTADKAKSTSWQPAAWQIRLACECLYGDPAYELDMCQRYSLPSGIRDQHSNITTVAGQIELEHHYRRIYTSHPDADQLFNRRDFQEWWLSDPARVKVMERGSTKQIIELMNEFKRRGVGFDPSTAR